MTANEERLMELMLLRATEGLSPSGQRELERLLKDAGLHDDDDLDLAVAAALNAFALKSPSEGAMPEGLKTRLARDAESYFASPHSGGNVADMASARKRLRGPGDQARDQGAPMLHKLGWAAAAMLLVALIVVGRPGPDDVAPIPDSVAARAELLQRVPGTLVIPWSRPEVDEYSGVSGDVVWNDDRQEGFLRLAGMPANDPEASQYQLWIVDPDRDQHPVDGGVFDIPAGAAEVVIPIDAKLAVSDPRVFAITREKPGGVVVSSGPLLVVASAG